MKVGTNISKSFGLFLDSLQSEEQSKLSKDTTFQIFYDLFRIREAQLKYKVKTNRGVDYSLSDIFQDIVAPYLRICLPDEYEVLLEHKQGKLRPDILIDKGNKHWAIIEIKTTIGWNRELVKNEKYMERLEELRKEFNLPLERIFYIFESSRNVSKEFASKYDDEGDKSKIKKFVLPLFKNNASPDKRASSKKFGDEEIHQRYKKDRILTSDFNVIINKIKD